MAAYLGKISVRVTPDTTGFAKELKADLEKINTKYTVDVDLNVQTAAATAALDKFRAEQSGKNINQDVKVDTSSMTRDLKAAGKDVDSLTSGFGRVAASVGKASLAIAAVNAALTVMNSVGPMAVQAVVAGALLMPGAMAAGAAAIATLKVGLSGVGDAVKNAFDPTKAKQFNQAMAKLAPNAKSFVRSLQQMAAGWRSMKLDVQNALFANMGNTIKKLGATYLPVVRKGMLGIATETNGVAQSFVKMLTSANNVKSVSNIFTNTKNSIRPLGTALTNLGQAFLTVASEATNWLPGFANGIAKATAQFSQFIAKAQQTGKLQQWIQAGINAFKQLWTIVKNLSVSVANVFIAIQQGAGGIASPLVAATAAIRAFTASAAGMQMFRSIGSILATVGKTVSGVLTTALRALAPVITALTPFINALVTAIGQHLQQAINVVAPKLLQFANFLSRNKQWVVPLATSLIGLAAAIRGLVAVSKGINAVSAGFNTVRTAGQKLGVVRGEMDKTSTSSSRMGGILKGALKGGLVAAAVGIVAFVAQGKNIGPMINNLANMITQFANNLPQVVTAIAQRLPGLITSIVNALVRLVPTLANAIVTLIPQLVQVITAGLPPLINALVKVIPKIITALAAVLPSLVQAFAQMIPKIITAVVTVLPQLIQAFVGMIPKIVTAVTNALPGLIGAFVGAIPKIITAVVNAIPGVITAFVNAIPKIVTAVANAIPRIVTAFVNAIPKIVVAIANAIPRIVLAFVNAIPKIVTAVVNALPKIVTAFVTAIPKIVVALVKALPKIVTAFVQSIPKIVTAVVRALPQIVGAFARAVPQIVMALVRLIPQLGQAGWQLIQGLWNGISKAGSWLWNMVSGWAKNIINGIKSFFGIASPSKVFRDEIGVFLSRGVAVGITKGVPDVVSAAESMKDAASKAASMDEIGTSFSGNLVKTVRADLHATASSPQFVSLPDKIAEAMSGLQWQIDPSGIAKLANKGNKRMAGR